MSKFAFVILAVCLTLSLGFSAQAQMMIPSVPPVLYNQSGNVVNAYNPVTGALNPGWYYDALGQPVYYYSNGTFYNPANGTYNGSAYYPLGSGSNGIPPSGVPGPGIPSVGGVYTAPGVPNTGAGGDALFNWVTLVVSGLVALGGVAYLSLTKSRKSLPTY